MDKYIIKLLKNHNSTNLTLIESIYDYDDRIYEDLQRRFTTDSFFIVELDFEDRYNDTDFYKVNDYLECYTEDHRRRPKEEVDLILSVLEENKIEEVEPDPEINFYKQMKELYDKDFDVFISVYKSSIMNHIFAEAISKIEIKNNDDVFQFSSKAIETLSNLIRYDVSISWRSKDNKMIDISKEDAKWFVKTLLTIQQRLMKIYWYSIDTIVENKDKGYEEINKIYLKTKELLKDIYKESYNFFSFRSSDYYKYNDGNLKTDEEVLNEENTPKTKKKSKNK